MDCPGSDKLAAYVEGRADNFEEVSIQEHCAECDDCRRELALGFQIRKAVPSASMPPALKVRMLRSIDSLQRDERHPGIARIQDAGDAVQSPESAAQRILAALPRLREKPSGDYVDIRKL